MRVLYHVIFYFYSVVKKLLKYLSSLFICVNDVPDLHNIAFLLRFIKQLFDIEHIHRLALVLVYLNTYSYTLTI